MAPVLGEIVGWELLLVLLLIALLFGSSKLPGLARSMGQAAKEFRKGVEEGAGDDDHKPAEKADDKPAEKAAAPKAVDPPVTDKPDPLP
jgi:sec-independent protein translocase protein TatA